MKILVFTAIYPPCIGGLSSHADEFNRHLASENTRITVFTCLLIKDSAEYEKINEHLDIIRFPAFEIVPNYPLPKFWKFKFWKLYLGLFKTDYELIISRIRFFNTSLLAMLFAKIKRIRWIHIEHTSNFTILSSPLKSFIAKIYDLTIGRLIFRSSDINISISRAVQKFVYKFDKRHSPIIYRGLNLEAIDSIPPDIDFKNRFKDRIIILTVARLYKWKGIEYSIEAIKNLSENIKKQIIFIVIGDGEDFSRLQELCDESTILLGSMPREKAIGIMKVSDIYIHSALHGGGLSTSLLEAMYCSCAIIATPNEGADEVINLEEDTLMEIPHIRKISATITNIISDKEKRVSMGREMKSKIVKKFSWEKSIKLYQKILERN
ncbi:MAG: glycosyltransferase family 4 protein [Candidatus Moraniibacteriota bacterium]